MTQDRRLEAIRVVFKNNNNAMVSLRRFSPGFCRKANTMMLEFVPTHKDPSRHVVIGPASPLQAQHDGTGLCRTHSRCSSVVLVFDVLTLGQVAALVSRPNQTARMKTCRREAPLAKHVRPTLSTRDTGYRKSNLRLDLGSVRGCLGDAGRVSLRRTGGTVVRRRVVIRVPPLRRR